MAERFAREPTPERVDAAIEALDEAIRRDPRQAGLYRWLAQFYSLRYGTSGAESDLRAAITAARQAIELYPQSPDEYLNLAGILAHGAAASGSAEWAAESRAEYQKALDLDAARPGTDEVRRWSAKRRGEIEAAMSSVGVSASRPG
jgi:tetratricopeptide (TPR) repeat protein